MTLYGNIDEESVTMEMVIYKDHAIRMKVPLEMSTNGDVGMKSMLQARGAMSDQIQQPCQYSSNI